jgi:hypothetical protein
MLKFVIKSTDVETRKVVSKGREFHFRGQTAFMHHDEEVRKVRVPLGDDQTAYAPGTYTVSDDSFTVGNYGDLEIGRLVLTPIASGVQKAS